jgi:23S rRNA (guanosine2251-2'-O)-methyltransferase
VSSSRERNDTRKPRPAGPERRGGEWIWGWHTVLAALENPQREEPRRLIATPARAAEIERRIGRRPRGLEIADAGEIARALPQGAAHQGLALEGPPPEPVALAELAAPARGVILMLDQVTDPQNVGAIFRSAAAFGARGLVLQDRHAPPLIGALAKAAAGAIDVLPHARETNLSRALEQLSDLGWRAIGLDADAAEPLEAALDGGPCVLVLGAEGEGLRRLVAEHCDSLARIGLAAGFESLNVSAAAAVALYAAARAAGAVSPAG